MNKLLLPPFQDNFFVAQMSNNKKLCSKDEMMRNLELPNTPRRWLEANYCSELIWQQRKRRTNRRYFSMTQHKLAVRLFSSFCEYLAIMINFRDITCASGVCSSVMSAVGLRWFLQIFSSGQSLYRVPMLQKCEIYREMHEKAAKQTEKHEPKSMWVFSSWQFICPHSLRSLSFMGF